MDDRNFCIAGEIEILPIRWSGTPPADDGLSGRLLSAIGESGVTLAQHDIAVVHARVVSMAEGRRVALDSIEPSPAAARMAAAVRRDPRVVELVLRESRQVVRMDHHVFLVENRHGLVCPDGGITAEPNGHAVLLLPNDPDASAERLRVDLETASRRSLAVVVSAGFIRARRAGAVHVAIGCSGIEPMRIYAGMRDPYGWNPVGSGLCVVDEISSAAALATQDEPGVGAAVVRGYAFEPGSNNARAIPSADITRFG